METKVLGVLMNLTRGCSQCYRNEVPELKKFEEKQLRKECGRVENSSKLFDVGPDGVAIVLTPPFNMRADVKPCARFELYYNPELELRVKIMRTKERWKKMFSFKERRRKTVGLTL